MKRKLLAAIMLIGLAFGVMAFAACDDSDTLKINSYGDGCADSPVKISVEAKRSISLMKHILSKSNMAQPYLLRARTNLTDFFLFTTIMAIMLVA